MKCIILLSLIALCYSYPYGIGYGSGYGYGSTGKNININQDGSITLTTPYGRRITITRGIGQNVVVDVDPNVSGYQYLYSYQKPDILAQILGQYKGVVSPNIYQQLLGEVNSAVQSGQLSGSVYEALQNWNPVLVGQYPGSYGYPGGLYQGQSNVFGGPYQQYPYGQQNIPGGVAGYLYGGNQGVPGASSYGTGRSWRTLLNSILYGSGPQYGQYGQVGQVGSVDPVAGQLSQIIQAKKQILNKPNQVQQQQFQQQQQQQQQLLVQQAQQQQLQQQQQNILGGAGSVIQAGQPGVYAQGGLYGGYGQGYNVPLVY